MRTWAEQLQDNLTMSERGFLLVRSGAAVRILQFGGPAVRQRPRWALARAVCDSALGSTTAGAWFQSVVDGRPDYVRRTFLFADGWEG